jgi:sulfotransferase
MKKYYFISGLPRSGSTLLSAILRQNKNFYADISSPLSEITRSSIIHLSNTISRLNIDESKRKNAIIGLFEGYYSDVSAKIIFDTSRTWTYHTDILLSLFPYTKIFCCVRNISSILNSFEKIIKKNPLYISSVFNGKDYPTCFSRCEHLMNENDGIVSFAYCGLLEAYSSNSQIINFIEYEDLCKYPEKIIEKIYNLINEPYQQHDFNSLNYSNELFDLNCNTKGLHTVGRKVTYKKESIIIPQKIYDYYNNMKLEFWKDKKDFIGSYK